MTADNQDFPVLVGDIGGTNSRFGLVRDARGELEFFDPVKTGQYDNLQGLVENTVFTQTSIMPKRFVFGIAGPVTGGEYKMTNSALRIIPREIIRDFRLKSAEFMNDFPAQALGVLAPGRNTMRKVGGGEFHENGIRVVLGPGTGFGLSILVPAGHCWTILPAETGYADFGLVTGLNQQRESQIQPFLKKLYRRQTVEALISGQGLENLYQAICRVENMGSNTELFGLSAPQISALAKKRDNFAGEAVEIFSRLLGRVAGNMALTVMARGGVYVTGGMAHKMQEQIEQSGFREEFEHKDPQREIVRKIPTFFVNHEFAALKGLANYVKTPDSYDLSHASSCFFSNSNPSF